MTDQMGPGPVEPSPAAGLPLTRARTSGLSRLSPAPRAAAILALSLSTAIWGASFVVSKSLVDRYDPLSILAVRFAIGTAVLLALRPGAVLELPKASRRHAAIIGVLVGAAQVPHYFGVRESTAAAAAFLIGTYVVMTPVVDRLLYGVRATRTTVGGTVLALSGLALFASGGTVSLLGITLCLTAAVLYAVQVSTLGAWVPPTNLWGFTTITMAGITAVVAVPALLRGIEVPSTSTDWLRLMYLALMAGVAAVALQAWGLRRVAATQAAVIMVMEPVWATGLAVTLTDEPLTWQLLVGGAVLLLANLVVSRGSRPPATGP